MRTIRNKQAGFSIIEVMVSLTIGLFLVAGITSIFVKTVATNNDTLEISRFNQEMRGVMELMSAEIRRAGFFENAQCTTDGRYLTDATLADCGNVGAQDNDFSPITIGTSTNANDCILFTYDTARDGSLDNAAIDNDFYGFKLDKTADNTGYVSSRANGTDCGSAWNALNNSNITNITKLEFDSSGSQIINTATGGNLVVREIQITLSGELISDPDVKLTLRNTIRLPNDRYCAGGACPGGI